LIAPIEQRLKRLLARRSEAIFGAKHAEPVVQALQKFLGRHDGHAHRGEFDRERHAFELCDDARHDIFGQRRIDASGMARPFDE
jgi:hypothetical protein